MPMIRTLTAAAFALALPVTLAAQTPARTTAPVQPPAAPETVVVRTDLDARAIREQFREVLQRFPPEVGRILGMDPSLLQSKEYLSQYPQLAAFLATHPEVQHNPSYYLQFVREQQNDWTQPMDARTETVRMWRNMMEGIGMFCIFTLVAGLFAWFIRTFIDYRRWLRISKVQTDVHNKLLERFAGTGELLAYIQSPAGRRFLESAPIPLDPGTRSIGAPFGRILWSAQAGVVLAILGIGFEVVSVSVIDDIGQPLSVLGVLAIALGIGFLVSAAMSYVLSRKLGLLDAAPAAAERHDSSLA
jgi:hypothetical protein